MPVQVTPYVPRTITVHLGPPDEWAENVTVSFPDYVKNVASSEIYPTWEPAAIQANILAITSFALNRVYTEFYPSRGYDFQITSTTAYDQKFIRGRNIFENISQVVDEIFNDYIRRRGFVEPLSAKFCNGTTSTCDGLSQWGSQSLALQGRNSVEILKHYYGDDIELVAEAPIRDIMLSYPGSPLRLGDTGPDVVVVQAMLNRIAQNYPPSPRSPPPPGCSASPPGIRCSPFRASSTWPRTEWWKGHLVQAGLPLCGGAPALRAHQQGADLLRRPVPVPRRPPGGGPGGRGGGAPVYAVHPGRAGQRHPGPRHRRRLRPGHRPGGAGVPAEGGPAPRRRGGRGDLERRLRRLCPGGDLLPAGHRPGPVPGGGGRPVLAPAPAEEAGRFADTPRLGQYPGRALELGDRDGAQREQGGTLV